MDVASSSSGPMASRVASPATPRRVCTRLQLQGELCGLGPRHHREPVSQGRIHPLHRRRCAKSSPRLRAILSGLSSPVSPASPSILAASSASAPPPSASPCIEQSCCSLIRLKLQPASSGPRVLKAFGV